MAAVPVPCGAAGGNVAGMVSHQRRAVALAALAPALLVPISALAARAEDRRARRAATCRTAAAPAPAARTSPDVRAASSYGPQHPEPIPVPEDESVLWCALEGGGHRHDATGPTRALLVETVLRRAQELGRRLTRAETRAGQRALRAHTTASGSVRRQ
ncbi:hypothetical protein QIS99_14065 [Streptomyces sp. B-S-A8]|uniref:Uncharacterized protein n=1 Tax=Streptomyces solicavernae TaxID=3043614 RepID=A0ABT6RSA3_9ACTN|nr:hypothetical protein [Streptomyces sp. B-S-A8]MDI3387317.1 hypothetical protein [Streptomyces sp. B-S-A8]